MKRYTDYTKEELAVLDSGQLKVLIDLEIAHCGILPVLPPVNIEAPTIDIVPTEVAFEVYGILFKNNEDATAFAAMPKYDSKYEYRRTGSNYQWLEDKSEYDGGVKVAKFYTKADIEKIADKIEEANRIKNKNDALQKEFSVFVNDTSAIRSEVFDAYEEAVEFVESIKKAKAVYEKHILLADGDKTLAEKFFRDAYKDNEEVIKAVLGE